VRSLQPRAKMTQPSEPVRKDPPQVPPEPERKDPPPTPPDPAPGPPPTIQDPPAPDANPIDPRVFAHRLSARPRWTIFQG
jgi:hypothetical protein